MDAAAFQAGLAWRQQGEQKKERAKQEATETQSLRKLMSIYDPENKDTYTSMGLGDLRGSAQAIAIKQQMDEIARQEADRAAEQQFYNMLGSAPGGTGPVAPATGNRMLSAAAQTGYRLPPQVLTQMMREGDGQNWDEVMPRPFEISGVKGAVGKSGQFQFLPSATPEAITAIPVLDEDGNVIGQRVPTGKGGTSALPQRQAKTLPDSYNSRLNTLMEQLDSVQGVLAKSDEELKKDYRGQDPVKLRAAKQADLERQQKALRDHVTRFKDQGYGDEAFWQSETQRLGLTASKPASQTVTTKAQFDALPKGAIYTGKDGKQYRKP